MDVGPGAIPISASRSGASIVDDVSVLRTSLSTLVSLLISAFIREICGSLSNNQLRNGLQLHVRRAFVNRAYLRVAPVFLNRIVFNVSIAAVQLDRFRTHALGDAR